MNEKELYLKAITIWGEEAQITMVYEELGELITTLAQFRRGRHLLTDLAEEIADVELMIDQLKFIYDIKEIVSLYRKKKLERLEKRLAEV